MGLRVVRNTYINFSSRKTIEPPASNTLIIIFTAENASVVVDDETERNIACVEHYNKTLRRSECGILRKLKDKTVLPTDY